MNHKKIRKAVMKLTDSEYFIVNALGKKLWSKQREVIQSIDNNKKTTVKACHGVGKSFIAGNLALAFLYKKKRSIVITTAPTTRQVEKLIWKEIRTSYNNAPLTLGGELLPKSPELQILQDEWYAIGFSTNDADKFQGFHEENLLVIVDEAAGVDMKIFEGIEGIISTMGAKLLLIGNPTNTEGEFFQSFRDESYNKITISAFDSPNFRQCGITLDNIKDGTWEKKFNDVIDKKGKLVAPKMVSPDWVYDKYKKWGLNSPLFQSKVLGQFPEQSDDSLIPITWVDLAIERWKEYNKKDLLLSKDKSLGADVAEYGNDEAITIPRTDNYIHEILSYQQVELMQYAKIIMRIADKYRPNFINVDVIGIGSGVEGRIKEDGKYKTNRVNVAESPGGENKKQLKEQKELFKNKRAQLYWYLREWLNPDLSVNPFPLCIPDDDLLISDLTNIKYKITTSAQIQIEDKKEFRKRIGRSPDRGDALMLACAPHFLLNKKLKVKIR